MGPGWSKLLTNLTIASCVIINGSVIIGAIIEIGDVLSSYFVIDVFVVKLCIIGMYIILSALIIEPEKLKPYAYVSSGVVISISTNIVNLVVIMFTDNVIRLLPDNIDPSVTHTAFDLKHMGIFFGIGGFAYEAAGTVFTSTL